MVQRTNTRRPVRRERLQPRELMLAGLGAISLGRKQAIKLAERLRREGDVARGTVEQRAQAAYEQLFANFNRVRGEVESRVRPLAAEAESPECSRASAAKSPPSWIC